MKNCAIFHVIWVQKALFKLTKLFTGPRHSAAGSLYHPVGLKFQVMIINNHKVITDVDV